MSNLSFSGHQSFSCKQSWLKKGCDFIKSNKKFNDDISVVDLGVGRNMVDSVKFWLKAFGLTDKSEKLTEIAEYLFGRGGRDKYLEDYGTVWLLHYHLVKTQRASIYNLMFNDFRKHKIDFTKEQLHAYLKRKCDETAPGSYSDNTIESDINVFFKNYVKPKKDEKGIEVEDAFSSILIDLDLVKHYKQRIENKQTEWFKIESEDRLDLPYQVILYSILDQYPDSSSIGFKELQIGFNSPGSIFALNTEGLYQKLLLIAQNYRKVIFTETAGNQILQFKSKIDKLEILNDYYA